MSSRIRLARLVARPLSSVAVLVCVVLVVGALSSLAVWSYNDRHSGGVTVVDTVLQSDGQRFVLAGTTAYLLPFYYGHDGGRDASLAAKTGQAYLHRHKMIADMRALGVNTLRIPLGRRGYDKDVYALGGKAGYLDRLAEYVDLAREARMRVLLVWWDSHRDGVDWLTSYRQVFPMMRAVRERLGNDPGILYEPWNEPHDVTWEQWFPVMKNTLEFFREDLHYRGVLFLDTIKWSWAFNPGWAQRVQSVDAQLQGKSQLVFANHRYANANTCFCGSEFESWQNRVGRYVLEFPIAGTEYGYWNGPGNGVQPEWYRQLMTYLAEVAVPQGLNGFVAFVWDWVDPNALVDDVATGNLTEHGRVTARFLQSWGTPAGGSE